MPDILSKLKTRTGVSDQWIIDTKKRGARVAKYRRYQDGEHDQRMSANMLKMLRIKEGEGEPLSLNHMDVVIQTMADRCILQAVEADNPSAGEWAQEVLSFNRYDTLQAELHEAAIRDGDAFMMVSYDEINDTPRFTFEDAFDGTTGVIPVYRSPNSPELAFVIKVWQIDGWRTNEDQLVTRVNLYFADRVEKLVLVGTGEAIDYNGTDEAPEEPVQAWTMSDGTPIGVPIIHFRNAGRRNLGKSELRDVITPQDALNRVFYSTIIAAEMTGFSTYVARGFEPPAEITPGAIIAIGASGLQSSDQVGFDAIPPGDLSQLQSIMEFAKQSVSSISRTPAPEFVGADGNASGESLKQREIGLLGKVKRFMARAGNAWEDALALAWRAQSAYGGSAPPEAARFFARWRSPEIRNDAALITNALAMQPLVGDKQTLRFIAPVYDLDEGAIDTIIDERDSQNAQRISKLLPNRFNALDTANAVQQTPEDNTALDQQQSQDGNPQA